MAEPDRPLLDRFREEVDGLGGELRQMAALRWQLARLEIDAGLRQARHLAVGLALAAVLGVVAVALVCVALAECLQSSLGGSRAGWLSLLAAVFVTSAALVGWLAWQAFRRRFTGLQETLEELREDAVWIGEWIKKDEP